MVNNNNNNNNMYLSLTVCVGFETIIAAPWKRFIAEVIDTILFAFLLKAYLPQADLRYVCTCVLIKMKCVILLPLRIPEILLEGSDVWDLIEVEEDVEEIKTVLQTFIFSVLMQKLHHAILAVISSVLFQYSLPPTPPPPPSLASLALLAFNGCFIIFSL